MSVCIFGPGLYLHNQTKTLNCRVLDRTYKLVHTNTERSTANPKIPFQYVTILQMKVKLCSMFKLFTVTHYLHYSNVPSLLIKLKMCARPNYCRIWRKWIFNPKTPILRCVCVSVWLNYTEYGIKPYHASIYRRKHLHFTNQTGPNVYAANHNYFNN